ncbi:MAG: hypothetical protein CR975_06835 [Gammaproteobacteria bacterium]|nr:MAG: hypothetical protein CR975_06835 [Gammaproteobacteria bacterium]
MLKQIHTTLSRDFSTLLLHRRFWGIIALWCGLCGLLFFLYLEDFMSIQPVLRAKNFRYGVTDLVLIPYIKSMGYAAVLLVTTLCAKLGYLENFSAFAQLYRSLCPNPLHYFSAKLIYIVLLSAVAVITIAAPAVISGLFFDYNGSRVLLLLIGLLALLVSVGLLTFVFSQTINHSVMAVLLSMLFIGLSELAAKFIVEPVWVTPIIAFFSPVSHLQQIANGVVTSSHVIFFTTFIILLVIIAVRQFNRTYFFSR